MTPFPLTYNIQHQEEYSRFLPLVKWLLVIPNIFVFLFVVLAAFFAWIGAFFAVLFTGRYPEGIFNFLVGVGRWGGPARRLLLPPHRQVPAVQHRRDA